ncbi:Nramp family divalent metal transporter [Candidatus Chlorohelix allophototropha]|uniref:Nramp family divalent metal transporter n=2 Tax=Candidatus Chlorohelix allophototropha TaxID=3003348 RepID=A0ABY9B940_9CHLR|nr:Nramp family divalent metal transporter [Chloroflexota bacterium L227-S17]
MDLLSEFQAEGRGEAMTINENVSLIEPNVSVARSAVLDEAHLGDIKGALGTIRVNDTTPRRSLKQKILTMLAIMGPGLIAMVGDNDAGGVATYSQAGQNYGTSLLWVIVLLIPVLIVNQEMVVRLGAVTGVGHARLILERFGKFWAAFSIGDLFLLNFLTIVTEFIGIAMALSFFGVEQAISVPVSAALLIIMVITGSFRRWERFMYLFIALNLILVPLLIIFCHPSAGQIMHDTFIPGLEGKFDSKALLLIIGIVGTTVAPWQLFFQQSNVIDKRITPRWIKYEQMDTYIGAFITAFGAAALIIAAAFAFNGTSFHGQFSDAGAVAKGFADVSGFWMGAMFSIFLLNASIIGAAAVSLSTAYAFGDTFGIKHSLHRNFKDARLFYVLYAGLVIVAAAIVLIPNAPLGLITMGVQALAGLLLPSATVFLLLLCNDKHVLGPWTNPTWLNVIGTVIIGVLMMLSFVMAITTVFPEIDVTILSLILATILTVGLLITGVIAFISRQKKNEGMVREPKLDKNSWRMSPLNSLPKPIWSTTKNLAMLCMWGYLGMTAIVLVFKVINMAIGA